MGGARPGLTGPVSSPQLPEQCRLMHIQPPKKKNKHKHKQSRTQDPVPPGKGLYLAPTAAPSSIQHWGMPSSSGALVSPETPSDSDHKKKKKKKEEDPERKRKKKEKKKKKVGGEGRGLVPSLRPPWGPPGSELGWPRQQQGLEPVSGRSPGVLLSSRRSHGIRVCPSSAEPAQPGAPGGGQLPGQQQQQLAVRPRRRRPGDPPANRNSPD